MAYFVETCFPVRVHHTGTWYIVRHSPGFILGSGLGQLLSQNIGIVVEDGHGQAAL